MTKDPKHLVSLRQRRILWLLSQGETTVTAADIIDTDRTSLRDSVAAVRAKLGCRTTTQAVLRAYTLGIIGPWEDCGSRLAYIRHQDADEDACPACLAGNVLWLKEQAEPRPEPVRPTDAQVRLLRALHAGRSHADIMYAWGISRSRLHRMIRDTYARLGVTDAPRDVRRAEAMRIALGMGLLAPVVVAPNGRVRNSPAPVRPLSAVEQQTLRVLAEGRSIAETAAVFGVPRTLISSRLNVIYSKVGVRDVPMNNRRQAAIKAARAQGWID